MTASELKEVLDEAGVIPSKRLGQNFLVDQNTAEWIVGQLNLQAEDAIVEVGPGTGALTEHVVGKVARVILVEYDRRLAEYLTKKFAHRPEVTVINHDAVRIDIRPFFAHKNVKLLGNLPYSAGGAILRNFLKGPSPFKRAVLMLQKEMIDRILAGPRCKDYGVLTLRMQCEWQGEPVKVVPPSCFIPRPMIDSTVMTLEPRQAALPVHDRRLFDELVRRGFAQRRKQLRKNLPDDVDWEKVCEKLEFSPTARAEELSLDDWVALTREVDPFFQKEEGQGDGEMLAVVDRDDNVVGSERRDVIHRDGLKHRAVHIFAFNQKGEIFLQKRSRLKDSCPGLWDSSAAGHVDAGEEYDACAARELEEELGLAGHDLREVGKLGAHANTGWEHVRLYATLAKGRIRFPCVEIEYGEWFGMSQIEEWVKAVPEDFAPGFLACWEVWKEANPGRFENGE
ncbi:16S rRNA (adenine(1518)-N(6)/adenine(1519)-N(6))-dimethyltransferase RsmA [Akkermansiaceae bacterium]|nr:16S rRNA (adenine(1518)-N(6)/adenine(1519)-N(6))-dimethyltransferase RsmA [Akkermansiaceae bacterium]